MSTYRVLVASPLIHDAIDDYDHVFASYNIEYDVPDVDQQLSEEELHRMIDRYDGVIAGDDHFTAEVIESAERLKVIAKWGIGLDDIDLDAAEQAGVTVTNTPGAFDDEVAEVVIGYTLMLARNLHHVDRRVRTGDWYSPRGISLRGKTFGVVGVGNIGSEVVRRAASFGMDVVGHDVVSPPSALVDQTSLEMVEQDELFERSDVVSLNCALTSETRGLVGPVELACLGEDGYLVNTARGGLVQQDALVKALRNDRIAGAALDVMAEEPLPKDNPLTDLENVILGSHNAQNTHEAVSKVNDRAVANVIEGLTGDRPNI